LLANGNLIANSAHSSAAPNAKIGNSVKNKFGTFFQRRSELSKPRMLFVFLYENAQKPLNAAGFARWFLLR
jgi:hypothetical protein